MKVILATLLTAAVIAVACGNDGFNTMAIEHAQEQGLVKNCKPESNAPARTEGETFITKGGVSVVVITEAPEANPAQANDEIAVHFTGSLADGTPFGDSREQLDGPFEFSIHTDDAICGFVEGVVGMSPGEVRELTIPPELAYGSSGSPAIPAPDGSAGFPGIPAHATVVFEIEMIEFIQLEPAE